MPHTHTPIINSTSHALTFACSDCPEGTYNIPPCGVVISATPTEEPFGAGPAGVALVRTTFAASPESDAALIALERGICHDCGEAPLGADGYSCPACGGSSFDPAVIAGSIIAAQAFPGRVLAMVPAPGFERVPPEQKQRRAHKEE